MHDRLARNALACATAALWALVAPAAVLWTARELLAVLIPGCLGAFALTLEWLMRREDRRRALLAAEHERLERLLVGAVKELHPRPHPHAEVARTRPDLRVVR